MSKMEKIKMEQQMIAYFEHEYEWAINAKSRNLGEPFEIVHNAKMRMYGVATFVQQLGIEYDFIEKNYNDYTERIEIAVLD